MKILPLTVLVYDGPIARAYLACMEQGGFRPANILLMVLDHHPGTKKRIPKWLPDSLRLRYAEKVQENSFNYWSRKIYKTNYELFCVMRKELDKIYRGAGELINEIVSTKNYEKYSDNIEKILISGLKDEKLKLAIERLGNKTILFTGGGIVPPSLFEIPETHILHIHPGKLPIVRGADGILWSILVRNNPGASCFYMKAGLDVGDIIRAEDLRAPIFDIKALVRPDDQTLYRALFSYYDPILRANFLMRVIENTDGDDLSSLSSIPQKESEGITYHFMCNQLRKEVLKKIFVS